MSLRNELLETVKEMKPVSYYDLRSMAHRFIGVHRIYEKIGIIEINTEFFETDDTLYKLKLNTLHNLGIEPLTFCEDISRHRVYIVAICNEFEIINKYTDAMPIYFICIKKDFQGNIDYYISQSNDLDKKFNPASLIKGIK